MIAGTPAAASEWSPHIVAFVCRWCSSAGADLAGTTRLTYPATVRLLRIPCTGRMNPLFIIKAFENGADGVLVSGCHPGDCHYISGNLVARRRFTIFRSLMDLLGLDRRRLHFSWVSAAEGHKWVEVVQTADAAVRQAGPLPQAGRHGVDGVAPPVLRAPDPVRHPPPATKDLQTTTAELRRVIGDLLLRGEVSRVVAYGQSPLPIRTVPIHICNPEKVDQVVWSQYCRSNLSVYLPRALELADRVGVVAKACDVKGVIGLVQEGQVKRDDVVIIGVHCGGVWCGESLADKCLTCTGEAPALCDVQISTPPHSSDRACANDNEDPRDQQLDTLLSLTPEQRWAFWEAQFERCLRCYACRAVCPLCYCDTCIADEHRPQWVPITIDERGNTAWNAVRAHHLAGRCTGCDECARVCPADIRLDLLNRHLAQEIERRFDYRSGEDPLAPPPMTVFRDEDPEEFIL